MILFLSLKIFTVLYSMEVLIGYIKAVPIEMAGGSDRRSTYAMEGVVASVNVRTILEEVKFLPLF